MNSTLTALWPYTDSWFNNLMTQSGAISVDDMISYPSSGISPGDVGSYLGNVALNYYYALEQLTILLLLMKVQVQQVVFILMKTVLMLDGCQQVDTLQTTYIIKHKHHYSF